MNVFSTVYLTVFLYLFLQYIWQYFCMYFQQYFLLYFSCTFTTVTVPSRLLHVCRRRRTVSANFAARSLRQVCRAAAQAQADRQIQSDQVCATEQLRPAATCTGAPWMRAEVPWQSWLAVDHNVTAEQRRPSDVEMVSSLSNRQPLQRKRSWDFLKQLQIENLKSKYRKSTPMVTTLLK